MKLHRLDKRTFVNADKTKVVDENSPDAAHLLGPEGFRIPVEYAQQLGLLEVEDESESEELSREGEGTGGEDSEPVEGEADAGEVEGVETEEGERDGGNGDEGVETEGDEGVETEGNEIPVDNHQLNSALSILANAGIEPEDLPYTRDADILAVDQISMGRLTIIRKYFPAVTNDDNSDSS